MVNLPKIKPPKRSTGWMRIKKSIAVGGFALLISASALALASTLQPPPTQASDHDDGDIDTRSRALSLTDLYVFRERDQNPSVTSDDLIFVMNTNPRSLARLQYFFSSQAQYDFNIARVNNVNGVPTAVPDLTLRFTFTAPDRNMRQRFTVTAIDRQGRTTAVSRTPQGQALVTTPLRSATSPRLNQVRVPGGVITAFAGLREDPFFFDVEQFFRVRAGLLGIGPSVGFRPPETAIDFASGYNVNSIVLRIPRRLLQAETNATAFDAWLSIASPDPRTGRLMKMEQIARPGINEALITNQRNYALFNQTQPSRTVPTAVANDAKRTLLALGNSEARANALLGAFIPDVMRIDTTGTSGFANALNTLGAPIRGRMLKDDVVDIA
ncbi:MAG: DUF4331 domain-containing protein, partial [Leptolyngbyaceae cyanobacterium SM1_3_5]|nr:DUF4331 domain-containing protein [Leptolyngbyaceae cyanobacterium SM1_3_5]